jgi:hypothetical protein
MREIRLSGSEGGGASALPTPIQGASRIFKAAKHLRIWDQTKIQGCFASLSMTCLIVAGRTENTLLRPQGLYSYVGRLYLRVR